jgi:hypothetical protein
MKGLRETLTIGLWIAAAIQTARYTWEACAAAGGWGSFPGLPSSGSGGTGSGPLSTPGVQTGGQAKSPLAKAVAAESNNQLIKGMGSPALAKWLSGVGNSVVNNTVGQLPIVGGFFRSTDANPGLLSNAQLRKLNNLPRPPQQFSPRAIRNLQKNGTRNQQRNMISQFQKWAQSHGWSQADARDYLTYYIDPFTAPGF